MLVLLKFSGWIDWLNERVGRSVIWLVLVAVLISAGNAVSRKAFSQSSNAFLEIQWYLFSAIFLLAAGYTLLRNEHVRIDILASRLSPRGQNIIDIIGILFFLLPMALLICWLAWPLFVLSFNSGEMSSNVGGLIRWPVKLLVPLGFALLILQALSELIKRVAFLMGLIPDPLDKTHKPSAEEELAAQIRAARQESAR